MRKLKNIELKRKDIQEFKQSKKTKLIIILDDIRSLNNIGSVFRTSDSFLIEKIYKISERLIDGNLINYTIKEKDYEINIFFDKQNYDLVGWQNVDMYQNFNITFISEIRKNRLIPKNLFKIPTPKLCFPCGFLITIVPYPSLIKLSIFLLASAAVMSFTSRSVLLLKSTS